MKYLLDTCVVSDLAKGDASTLNRIKTTSPRLLVISSVTMMETEFGLTLNKVRARKPVPVLHAFLGAMAMLPYRTEDARATATLRATLQIVRQTNRSGPERGVPGFRDFSLKYPDTRERICHLG